MGWESALIFIAAGIWMFFVVNGPQAIAKTIMNGKIKVAEANARTEEARLERVRLEKSDR